MTQSPGHQQHPDHKIQTQPLRQRMSVTAKGEVIAESNDVLQVKEDGSPVRLYFPRSDVNMNKLQPSETTSRCPFKGTARYFNVVVGNVVLRDAVWSYEQPYDEHRDLQGRLAFYDDKVPELHIGAARMAEGANAT
jgi:uncharacterized protein (DUF427 family)